jgi:predicted RNase H-like nuclease (RuvC/YqgF family)
MFLKMTIALLMSSAVYGQSLGDVARDNREKKSEDASAAQPKLITNADLPKDPDANQEPRQEPSGTGAAASSKAADHRSAEKRLAEQRAAEHWKRQILAQKNKMAVLQARIDQLNASIQSAYGTVQTEGPYNRYQARQLQRVAQIQQQLDEQKRELDEMQDAARHAGMHTAVYDP